jgi:hypothetical protein
MRKLIGGAGSLGLVALVTWIPLGCSAGKSPGGEGSGGAGGGTNLPLVTPPVVAATPTGLQGPGMGSTHTKSVALHPNSVPAGVGVSPDGAAPPPPGPGSDGGMSPPAGMCPGSGGVCPDGGMSPGPGPGSDGGMGPLGAMCPGSGGICTDGGMTPDGSMGITPDGGMGPGARTGLDPLDIKSRFFSAGPTNIFAILAEIDGRIGEINQRSKDTNVPCLSQPPVAYTLTPFGQSVPFYAQCVLHVSTPMPTRAAFLQFGMNNGVVYLYEAIGAAAIGARLTPIAGGSGQYSVEAWMGVGYENATGCGNASGFDDCSYGVMALEADPVRVHFELSVAGIGFGYCGAQLRSDGMTVLVQGSSDMGATCGDSASVCVLANDLTMATMCASTSFELPAIGRAVSSGPNGMWAASRNGSQGVVLDGTASDALAFGPSAPTPGVPEFASTPMGPPPDGGGVPGRPGDDASPE